MSEELELMPCPFCGSKECSPAWRNHKTWVECDTCGAKGRSVSSPWVRENRADSELEAASQWNARAALKAGQGEAVAYAQAWCVANEGTPAEFLSYSLLVKRSAVLGRALTWREAIELTALTTSMPDAERDALLAMDDDQPATDVNVPRELLESLIERYDAHAMIRATMSRIEELRALLAQSQEVKS